MTKILLINDDGIDAIGLRHLFDALHNHYDLTIVAPNRERSGASASLTYLTPIVVEKAAWHHNVPAWKIEGTPADCVKIAITQLLPTPPDLVISGINHGSNSGCTAIHSGTVGGVIDAALRDIPAIAFSAWEETCPLKIQASDIQAIVAFVLANPSRSGTLFNVNFPRTVPHRGIRLARQGRSYWRDNTHKIDTKDGKDFYHMAGAWAIYNESLDSDIHLLKEGYVTVVPLYVGEFTDHTLLKTHRKPFEEVFHR